MGIYGKGRGNKRGESARKYRRESAAARLEARQQLTPAQKLKQLDQCLGKNKGATKERARLTRLVKENN